MRTQFVIMITILATCSTLAHARVGADMVISPTNRSAEGLTFDVAVEDKGRIQATVVVTCTRAPSFPTNIHSHVEVRDKDGLLGAIPAAGKIEGNQMTIFATFDRRAIDYSDVVVSTVSRFYPIDVATGQPTPGSSGIVAGRAYRVRIAAFMKKDDSEPAR